MTRQAKPGPAQGYGSLESQESREAHARGGGVKLVDHPLYEAPQLRTSARSILPRLCCLCLILLIVCFGSGYLMYTQLASGYVAIKPGTTKFQGGGGQYQDGFRVSSQHHTDNQGALKDSHSGKKRRSRDRTETGKYTRPGGR